MGVAVSLGFFAIGAILAFAVDAHPSDVSIHAIGVIFMIVSVIGFRMTLYRESWRRRVVEETIDQGTEPPLMLDDTVFVEDSRPDRVIHEVVHESVVRDGEPRGDVPSTVGTGRTARDEPR